MEIVYSVFLAPLVTGLLLFSCGLILYEFPPKKINSFYGYRTARSRENQNNWDFAQLYSAKELMKIGGVLVLLAVVGYFFELKIYYQKIGSTIILVFAFVITSVRTENALKKRF